MHLLPARRQSGYRCLKLASISCWKLWLQKLTWNCTEWVCSSNWSGSTSAKITFIFAYMSSPLPVYPMINSTWMGSRTKGNKMVSHLLFFRRKKKVKEQKKLRALTFFTTLRQEPLCSLGTGQSDCAVTLIWNKIYKSQMIFFFFFNKLIRSLQMTLLARNEFLLKSTVTKLFKSRNLPENLTLASTQQLESVTK